MKAAREEAQASAADLETARQAQLVALFPDWGVERFPLYAYYPPRQYLAPKTRASLEFLSTTVRASLSRKALPG